MSLELEELELGIEKLKNENKNNKKLIQALNSEKSRLKEKSNYLSEKLKEAYSVYEEAGKRILDFVESEISPARDQLVLLRKQIDELKKKTREHDTQIDEITRKKILQLEKQFEKALNQLKESSTEERTEDKKEEFSEFKKELEKIAELEKQLKLQDRKQESRLSEIAKQNITSQEKQRLELQRLLEKFKADIESRRKEDIESKLREHSDFEDNVSKIENQLGSLEKSYSTRAEEISKSISLLQQELARQQKGLEENTLEDSKTVSNLRADFDDKISSLREDLQIQRKTDLQNQIKEFRKEIDNISNLEQDFDTTIAKLKEDFQIQRKEDFQIQLKEFKKELDRISQLSTEVSNLGKNQASKSADIYDNIAALRRRLSDQENKLNHIFKQEIISLAELKKEMNDNVADLRRIIEKESSENTKEDMKRFSEELRKMSGFEQRLDTVRKIHEKRLEEAFNELAAIRTLTDSREQRSEHVLAEMNEALAAMKKGLASKADTSQQMKQFRDSLEKTLQLEKQLNALLKSTDSQSNQLRGEIDSLSNSLNNQQSEVNRIWEDSKKSLSDFRSELDSKLSSIESRIQKSEKTNYNEKLKQFRQELEKIASLENKIDNLEKDQEAASTELTERIENVRNQSQEGLMAQIRKFDKSINDIERQYLRLEKKTGMDDARIEKSVMNALSDEKFLKSAQENTKKWLDSEISRLNSRVSDSMREQGKSLESMSSQLRSFTDRFMSEKERLDNLETEKSSLDREISRVESRINELDSKMDKKSDIIWSEINSKLDNELKSLESMSSKDIKKLSQKVSSLDIEKISNDNFNNEMNSFRKVLESNIDEVTGQLQDIENSKLNNTEFNEKISNLSDRIKDINERIDTAVNNNNQEFDGVNRKLSDLEKGIEKDAEKIWGQLSSKIKNEANRIKEGAYSDIKGIFHEIDDLKTGKTSKSEALLLQQKIDELNTKADTLGEKMDAQKGLLESKIGKVSEDIHSLEEENKSQESLNTVYSQDLGSLRNQLKTLDKQNRDIKADIATLEEKIKLKETNIDSLVSQQKKDLGSMKMELHQAILDMDKRLQAKKYDTEQKLVRFQKELKEVSKLAGDVDTFEKKRKETIRRVQDVENQLGSIRKLDKRLSALEELLGDIDRKFKTFEAPESLKKWFEEKLKEINKGMNSEVNTLHEKFVRNNDEISLLKNSLEEEVDVFDKTTEELKIRNSRLEDKLESNKNYLDDKIDDIRDTISKSEKQIRDNLENMILEESSKNLLKLKKEVENIPTTEGEKLKYILSDMNRVKEEAENQIGKIKNIAQELKGIESKIKTNVNYDIESRIDNSVESAKARLLSEAKRELGKTIVERDELDSIIRDLNAVKISAENEIRNLKQKNRNSVGIEDRIKSILETHFSDLIRKSVEKKTEGIRKDLTQEISTAWKELANKDDTSLSDLYKKIKVETDEKISQLKKDNENLSNILNKVKLDTLTDSEMIISKKVENKTADALQNVKNKIESLESMISTNANDNDILNKKLNDLEISIEKLSKKPGMISDDFKKFKEYVISYINEVVDNYDSKFRNVRREVQERLNK